MLHSRSLHDRTTDIYRSPDRFTKNPDLIRLDSGRLMLVYSDTDSHWSQVNQILTTVVSDDDGLTWSKHREVATADLTSGDERLVTPRLSVLHDGRLIILCDHNDESYFHEDQGSGNWAWWSEDEGETWSDHQVTGIVGFEPDRAMDLPDGTVGVISQIMRGESQEFAVILSVSNDAGLTWHESATVAHDGYHRFCEGALVILHDGQRLACVMRENHSAGIPSFVAFSDDCGATWGEPQPLPFALHRPYAKQLEDGRVFVTGRQVNGGLGCYGWCGDIEAEAGSVTVGGPPRAFDAELANDALVIRNHPDHECRYTLLPAEDGRSDIDFEAEVRVDGPADEAIAFMSINAIATRKDGPPVLNIYTDHITLNRQSADFGKPIDMTVWRTVRLRHRRGLLTVSVDGEILVNASVFRESPAIVDFRGGDVQKRTQFGQLGSAGTSWWRRVDYSTKNRTLPNYAWTWRVEDGKWPDQYQRDRMIQIHANDEHEMPDHGYSSWLVLPDGRIVFVDYTNRGDELGRSHLVGCHITVDDLA
jgi:hypothetical protein